MERGVNLRGTRDAVKGEERELVGRDGSEPPTQHRWSCVGVFSSLVADGRRKGFPPPPACAPRSYLSWNVVSFRGSQPGVEFTKITNGSLPFCSKL